MGKYTEEVKVLTKRGELPLGAKYSKKPVIVRTYANGILEIIPAEVKPMISAKEIKQAHSKFKTKHSEAYRILKDG